MTTSSLLSADRQTQVVRLLASAGLGPECHLVPLAGGGNNQVFRVEGRGPTVVLKAYYYHPDDPRDRLGTEYSFLSFAWRHGVRCVPQPLACDTDARLALYEFIPGRKLALTELSRDAVQQAIDFFRQINDVRGAADAQHLPPASEACFSLADHLHCLRRRVDRLQHIGGDLDVDQAARRFVRDQLLPAVEVSEAAVRTQCSKLGLAIDAPLAVEARCLSPSDFGFHNALLVASNRLKFLDFEYAGWDDPAKLLSDFFSQPDCPVPMDYYGEFARTAVAGMTQPDLHRARFQLLLPVYRLKWCCIVLNEFLPWGSNRRHFARPLSDALVARTRQLAKAAVVLSKVFDDGGLSNAA
jgi:hypothetical protein